jgi:hypothetical protein
MRRHARDVYAKSRPKIVIRSLILPIGPETRGAFIPIEEALPLLVGHERPIGLVENGKGLVASDLEQVINVRVYVIRGDPTWRRNQDVRTADQNILGHLSASEPHDGCEDVAEKRPCDWVMNDEPQDDEGVILLDVLNCFP